MNKPKIVIVSACVVVLAVVCVLMFRWVAGLVFSTTQQLQQMGEQPTATALPDEGAWVAPTMPIDYEDGDDGMSGITPEADTDPVYSDPDDGDDESVPVDATAEQLAGTTSNAQGVDGTVEDDLEDAAE